MRKLASATTKPHPQPSPARSAGVLLHVVSLPGPYGIGDLGPAACKWVDTLAHAGQTWWQVLPLNPTGAANSPYQSYSAFSGNPDLISPDALLRDGLLRREELVGAQLPADFVAYERARALKLRLLKLAWDRFKNGAAGRLRELFNLFRREEARWLDDAALFIAIKSAQAGASWQTWPRDLAMRKTSALRQARMQLADVFEREQFIQFLFYHQLNALRDHARSRGVKLLGDLPLFVSEDSADVWAHPELFRLDRQRRPKVVAGVPPDIYSNVGQRWGNPLYDWPANQRENFAWWVSRFRALLRQVDMVRIDHFRGLEACWEIPVSSKTSQRGQWVKSPGAELLQTVRNKLGRLPFIAEDLGLLTPEVDALRERFGLPSMRVLQFAFVAPDPGSRFLPHNFERNTAVYTATHDNDTAVGWYAALKPKQRARLLAYLPGAGRDIAWSMIRLAWSSVANYAIVPLQDVMELGSEARMNRPGTTRANWRWRFTDKMLHQDELLRLAELTRICARGPGDGPKAAGHAMDV